MRYEVRFLCGAAAIALAIGAAGPAASGGQISTWDGSLDGWAPVGDASLSNDTVGVTQGTQSLKITRSNISSGWNNTMMLGGAGGEAAWAQVVGNTKLQVDVTAQGGSDVPAWWGQLFFVIQGQGLTWTQSPQFDLVLDGQPHTYTWDYSAIHLPAVQSGFEIFLPINTGSGQTAVFHMDNLRTIPEPAAIGALGVALVAMRRRR